MSGKQNCNNTIQLVDLCLVDMVKYTTTNVYMLCNEVTKTCFIGFSSNLVLSLGRILEGIRQGSGEYKAIGSDLENIVLVVLETGMSKEDLRLRHSNWCDRYYNELGYKSYKDVNPLTYSLSIDLLPLNGRYYHHVFLVNLRGDKKLVGIFERKVEMKEWIRLHYPSPRIKEIVIMEGLETMRGRHGDSSNKRSSRSKT